jgi:hypothetical protein
MKLIGVLLVMVFVGVLVLQIDSPNDNVDNSWRPSAYNREVTKCLEGYASVDRVYDFDKMSDRTNEQLSEITGVNADIIAKCRR